MRLQSVKCGRWDPSASELINDELGVAYPVVDGIPHLTPDSGRVLNDSRASPVPGSAPEEVPVQPS